MVPGRSSGVDFSASPSASHQPAVLLRDAERLLVSVVANYYRFKYSTVSRGGQMFANQCRLRYDVHSIHVADNMNTPKLIARDHARHAGVCGWSQRPDLSRYDNEFLGANVD